MRFSSAMVLGRDARALVDAELQATYSRKGVDFSLLKTEYTALGDYFSDADMDVNSIQWHVDKADVELPRIMTDVKIQEAKPKRIDMNEIIRDARR